MCGLGLASNLGEICASSQLRYSQVFGALGDAFCRARWGRGGCVDCDRDACALGEVAGVRLLNKMTRQRSADISPNCASKLKSMTPSGMMSAISLRCRITSQIAPQGESVPKFQKTAPSTRAAITATTLRMVRTDRSAFRAKRFIPVSGDF
jgi:hypothetical protein